MIVSLSLDQDFFQSWLRLFLDISCVWLFNSRFETIPRQVGNSKIKFETNFPFFAQAWVKTFFQTIFQTFPCLEIVLNILLCLKVVLNLYQTTCSMYTTSMKGSQNKKINTILHFYLHIFDSCQGSQNFYGLIRNKILCIS